jgi:hypothetical protein
MGTEGHIWAETEKITWKREYKILDRIKDQGQAGCYEHGDELSVKEWNSRLAERQLAFQEGLHFMEFLSNANVMHLIERILLVIR